TQTATVEAVDAIKRTVTLKTSDGVMAMIHCGPQVVNFDQIQVGDQVHATVLDRLVVFVGKPGSPSIDDGLMIARAPKGSKPGVLICEITSINDKIVSIDAQNRTVTLKGIEGKPQTFKVAPDVDLSNVKAGDELVVRCTSGLALMVEKPAEPQLAAGKIKPGDAEMAIEAITTTATVESIDATNRLVTLKGSQGGTRTIHLGKECINFDQIKVGDKVKATLAEAMAVAITKAGGPPSADLGMLVARAPAGSKPGVIIADTDQITSKLEAIDAESRTVALIGPDGKTRKMRVGSNVDLSALKIGDDVVVKCTQALAIVVEAP
ncbi:MAG: hypothetical protein ACREJC_08300, partial [Tepidisphaeraceae bacterium]